MSLSSTGLYYSKAFIIIIYFHSDFYLRNVTGTDRLSTDARVQLIQRLFVYDLDG
jgi:hypothetical protein